VGTLPAATDAADGFATGLRGGLSLTAHLVSGAALMFVSLLCISPAGDAIWRWIQGRSRPGNRDRVAVAGAAAWSAASGYVRASRS
jgi:hypothetical protein